MDGRSDARRGRTADARESGATAVEYAIVASLIAAVVTAAVAGVGTATTTNFADPALRAIGG